MSALKSLTAEHQMIVDLLAALQTYAARLRSGASVDPADLARFSEVFRELVDYRHHEKEEGILLPFLARNGFDWSKGLLAELHREHGHLRYLIDVLCQAAARDSVVSREQRRQIAEAAAAFVDFKRGHIDKEERLLMPAILQRLSPSALEQLGAELAQFDEVTGRNFSTPSSSPSSGSAAIYQQAADLVQRYSEDSTIVDVTGVKWGGVSQGGVSQGGVSQPDDLQEGSLRARRDGFTSFGRSR
jgi:hemerythrin-like domain-containing protein